MERLSIEAARAMYVIKTQEQLADLDCLKCRATVDWREEVEIGSPGLCDPCAQDVLADLLKTKRRKGA